MKIYCPKCGNATEYSLQAPSFCSSCGNPFKGISSKAKVKKVIKTQASINQPPSEIYDYSSLGSLDFNLKVNKQNVHKLGDILGSDSDEDDYIREKDSDYSKDNIEKDFFRDAGSLKNLRDND